MLKNNLERNRMSDKGKKGIRGISSLKRRTILKQNKKKRLYSDAYSSSGRSGIPHKR